MREAYVEAGVPWFGLRMWAPRLAVPEVATARSPWVVMTVANLPGYSGWAMPTRPGVPGAAWRACVVEDLGCGFGGPAFDVT